METREFRYSSIRFLFLFLHKDGTASLHLSWENFRFHTVAVHLFLNSCFSNLCLEVSDSCFLYFMSKFQSLYYCSCYLLRFRLKRRMLKLTSLETVFFLTSWRKMKLTHPWEEKWNRNSLPGYKSLAGPAPLDRSPRWGYVSSLHSGSRFVLCLSLLCRRAASPCQRSSDAAGGGRTPGGGDVGSGRCSNAGPSWDGDGGGGKVGTGPAEPAPSWQV